MGVEFLGIVYGNFGRETEHIYDPFLQKIHEYLLSGDLEPSVSKLIKFDVTDVKPCLPYHVAFQIHVAYSKYTIKRVVVDEGAATCVMSLVCWKALGSLTLSKSLNMLNYFDGHAFHP